MITIHMMIALVFIVDHPWWAIVAAAGSYLFLQQGSAGWLHRFFSHRCFETSRWFQAALAFWGGCCCQRGAIWWAAHHRQHHAYTEETLDPHSPHVEGFWHAHLGWVWEDEHQNIDPRWVKDLLRYPELRLLNRWYWVPPICYWIALVGLGALFGRLSGLGAFAGGISMLVWAGAVATVAAWHATFAINSVTHLWGRRRYGTDDESRNSMLLALVNHGEGWHNNHHHYPHSANSGFYWWEIDLTFYFIVLLEKLGLVWNVRRAPQSAIQSHRTVDTPPQ